MPPPSASAYATATRFAALWIGDAITGDEAFDFSMFQALVRSTLSKSLAGAPEATRERLALRGLQQVSSAITAGGTAGALRVDDAHSCDDVLLRLITEVGSSGNWENDLLPPFSQDILEIIRTKKHTLPETSFQLLKGVDPQITSMDPPPQLKHNGIEQCDNDQSMCSSHEHINIEKPTDNAEVQQETMENLVNESETGNLQKDPSAPTSVLHQPCMPDSRSYVPPQEDTIDAVGLGAKSPERSPFVEGNMSVGSMLSSAGCDAPLQGSITEPFSQQDSEDHTATVERQSCRQKSPNLPHCVDGERPDDGGSSNQSSKVSSHDGLDVHATVTPDFDRVKDDLPTDASEPAHLPECITTQGTTMTSHPQSSKAHLSALQNERGDKVNQNLEDVCASIRPMEKDHVHGDLTLQAVSVLLSVRCHGAIQGSKSGTYLQAGNTTEDMMVFEEHNAEKSHVEVSGANKANQTLHDDGSILKNHMVHGGLTAQTAPVYQNCNVTLHGKTSKAFFSEQIDEKSGTNFQKDNCHTSIPSSSHNGNGESAKKTSNEEKFEDTSPEICVHSKDQDTNDTPDEQDLCVKCGKVGQLLKCSDCFLVAHDSYFGSLVTFEETDMFYCPVCFYKKATEAYQNAKKAYCKSWKDLNAFLGTTQVVKQHDEQLNGVQRGAAKRYGHSNESDMSKRNVIHQNEAYEQLTGVQSGAANRDGHSNGCDMSKRKSINQNEAYNTAYGDEESHQQSKKQKINARGNNKEALTEKVSFQNSRLASMNKHSVLQNNNNKRVNNSEKEQQVGHKEACRESGNDNISHETRAASQRRCDPPANQDVEAGCSDEIEATSSDDSDAILLCQLEDARNSVGRKKKKLV